MDVDFAKVKCAIGNCDTMVCAQPRLREYPVDTIDDNNSTDGDGLIIEIVHSGDLPAQYEAGSTSYAYTSRDPYFEGSPDLM